MKLSCIDQSVTDGDCYLLNVVGVSESLDVNVSQRNILFGSLLR